MASYVVLERRPVTGSRPETVFVRDEFSYVALVFPLVWLLWNRLWFAAVMLLMVSVAMGLAGEYLMPGPAVALAGLAIGVFVALEGAEWRLERHRRDGFADAGTVMARNLEEAEIRWFAGDRSAPVPPALPVRAPRATTPPPLPAQPADMLFGYGEQAR